jgi:hypothetical protein
MLFVAAALDVVASITSAAGRGPGAAAFPSIAVTTALLIAAVRGQRWAPWVMSGWFLVTSASLVVIASPPRWLPAVLDLVALALVLIAMRRRLAHSDGVMT